MVRKEADTMKLTKSQMQMAVRLYARKHDLYVRTVKAISAYRYAAFREYIAERPYLVK